MALVVLHFALCLAPSSIPFSGTEWVILVFFVGRILKEVEQFLNSTIKQKKEGVTKTKMGLKYNRCDDNAHDGESESKRVSISVMLAKKCGKYFR